MGLLLSKHLHEISRALGNVFINSLNTYLLNIYDIQSCLFQASSRILKWIVTWSFLLRNLELGNRRLGAIQNTNSFVTQKVIKILSTSSGHCCQAKQAYVLGKSHKKVSLDLSLHQAVLLAPCPLHWPGGFPFAKPPSLFHSHQHCPSAAIELAPPLIAKNLDW